MFNYRASGSSRVDMSGVGMELVHPPPFIPTPLSFARLLDSLLVPPPSVIIQMPCEGDRQALLSSRLCLSPTPSTRSGCFPPPTYSTGHPGRPPGPSSLAPRQVNSTGPSVGGRSLHSSLFSGAFLRTLCQQYQKVCGIRLCPICGCVLKKKFETLPANSNYYLLRMGA